MSGQTVILRVQDKEGRGPYRPGLSQHWADSEGPDNTPWWMEIGITMPAAMLRMSGPYHYGCGFRSHEQFRQWFTRRELRRLDRLGFALVSLLIDTVVAETPTQIVFGKVTPLTDYACRYRLATASAPSPPLSPPIPREMV